MYNKNVGINNFANQKQGGENMSKELFVRAEEVADFRKLLDDNGYKYEYLETGEGHIWRNWRIYLTEFAPKLFK